MKRIFQLCIAAPLCVGAFAVTGQAQPVVNIGKSFIKGADRYISHFTVPVNLSKVTTRLSKQNPLKSDLELSNAVATVEYNAFGKDLYTAVQERAVLANLFNNHFLSLKTSKNPTLELGAGEESNNQAWWAKKNFLITHILVRENPAEMAKLESAIPDLRYKITSQDVLFLTLLKKWKALNFLTHKGVRLNDVFGQPSKHGAHDIEPADLILNMARENDKAGLEFLVSHGVDLNRVFTAEEIKEIAATQLHALEILAAYGLEVEEQFLPATAQADADAKRIADIQAWQAAFKKAQEKVLLNQSLHDAGKLRKVLAKSNDPVTLARGIQSRVLDDMRAWYENNPLQSLQSAQVLAQTYVDNGVQEEVDNMVIEIFHIIPHMNHDSLVRYLILSADLLGKYGANANHAFKQLFYEPIDHPGHGYERAKFLQLYLRYGADVNQPLPVHFGEDSYAILRAIELNEDVEVLEMLCEEGADINVQDAKGNTALHKILERAKTDWDGQLPLIKMFDSYGVDITVPNHEGITPQDMLRQLIKNESDQNHYKQAHKIRRVLRSLRRNNPDESEYNEPLEEEYPD